MGENRFQSWRTDRVALVEILRNGCDGMSVKSPKTLLSTPHSLMYYKISALTDTKKQPFIFQVPFSCFSIK